MVFQPHKGDGDDLLNPQHNSERGKETMKYKYVCKECGKPATQKRDGVEPPLQTLGTWRCSEHGKVAVRREKA